MNRGKDKIERNYIKEKTKGKITFINLAIYKMSGHGSIEGKPWHVMGALKANRGTLLSKPWHTVKHLSPLGFLNYLSFHSNFG